ncbi:MAG TPA: energy-coupling factor transporter transmembrane component T [Jatrophihabitantaceae bacterium]|nr:energy-coupling factor transporter transmembrane component T [Jatrophihabitantaceae bacterium]
MTLVLGAPVVRRRGGTLNPTSKVLAMAVVAVPLFLSTDAVTSGIMVAVELVALPLLGVGPRMLGRAGAPILFGLAGIWLANWIVSGNLSGLVAVSLRLVALGLPGLLLVVTTDPVDLADALVQRWHVSPRFAYGALAALRLIPLLIDEVQTMRRARRARGIGAGWTPVSWARLTGGLLFGMLVQAIRRGVRLAAAMDSRGFDSAAERTFARQSTVTWRDHLFVLATAIVVAVAVAVSMATGHWHLLFS